jgi:hypothetical protein
LASIGLTLLARELPGSGYRTVTSGGRSWRRSINSATGVSKVKTSKVTRAIVAFAPIAVLSSVLSLSDAQADTPGKTLILSVYLDTAGADSVLAGDYTSAIRKITSHSSSDSMGSLAAATNLCVAYTMTRQWDEAKSKCDGAVIGARLSDADDVFDFGAARQKRMATAYSNRAVFNWLRKERQKAVADVTRARSLAPRLESVAQNWTALSGESDTAAHPTVASTRP